MNPTILIILFAAALAALAFAGLWLLGVPFFGARSGGIANAASANTNSGTNNGRRTFIADGAVTAYTLVKFGTAANEVATAGAAARPIGVALDDAADGEAVSVFLFGCASGTVTCIAAGAIAAKALCYGKASGKVDDTSATNDIPVGYAINAAAADGDQVEIIPCAFDLTAAS